MPPTQEELELIRKLNEPGGKLFELLSLLMLEEASGKQVIFQPRPSYMQINPDLAVGDEEAPIILALVTHATAKNAAGVKVDRSLEELFEAKTLSPPRQVPIVINLIWHSPVGWATGHIARLENAFDFTWIAFRDCKAYRALLPVFVKLSSEIALLEFEEAMNILRRSNVLKPLMIEFGQLFHKAIDRSNSTHPQLWLQERRRCAPFKSKTSFAIGNRVKLDLMSLLVVPPATLPSLLNGKGEPYTSEFDPAIQSEAVVRFRSLVKNEVRIPQGLIQRMEPLVSFIGVETIETALTGARDTEGYGSITTAFEPEERTERRISLLREASANGALYELVQESWDKSSPLYNGRCWAVEFGTTLVKACLNDDYGLLALQREALGDSRLEYYWNLLIWYVRGKKDALTESEVQSVCSVLEKNISRIGTKTDNSRLAKDVREWLAKELRKIKTGNPLPWLIRATLADRGVTVTGFPGLSIQRYCPFAALSGLANASGVTRWHLMVGKKNKRILHVLSSYSSTHKHKEYSAKARLAHYVVTNGSIARDTAINGIAIILDGVWRESEVNMFQQAGVDVFAMDDPKSWLEWASTGA